MFIINKDQFPFMPIINQLVSFVKKQYDICTAGSEYQMVQGLKGLQSDTIIIGSAGTPWI